MDSASKDVDGSDFMHLTLDRLGRRVYVNGSERRLSSAKFDLLCYLVDHAGQAISARELVRQGLLLQSQATRYKSIILELRNQLGVARCLIQSVPGYGYRLDLEATTRVRRPVERQFSSDASGL